MRSSLPGALVAAGVFEQVAVVGGCSLAKLGMKFQGHLAKGYPIVEDVLAGFAALVGRDDGRSPVLRLDAIGRHSVGAGGAQQAILEALTVKPLERLGLRLATSTATRPSFTIPRPPSRREAVTCRS